MGAVVGAVQPQVDEGMEAGLLRLEGAEHARGCLAARGELGRQRLPRTCVPRPCAQDGRLIGEALEQ